MPQWEYCTLSSDETFLYYQTYQTDGLHTTSKPFNAQLWASCIALLGTLGWEAVGATPVENGLAWHFKRMFDPANGTLQL